MTKKQEEAIEYLKKYRYDNEVYNAINIVLSMLEEKDKIIDLMSEELTTPIHNKKWVRQYYENKVKNNKEAE